MFGFRDVFRYFQCRSCRCLQIAELPTNLDHYYPPDYYSFAPVREDHWRNNWARRRIVAVRSEAVLFQRGIWGRLVNLFLPMWPGNIHRVDALIGFRQLGKRISSLKSSILDVGCGSGAALLFLNELGFGNLCGVDPFIPKDIEYSSGVRILKKSIHDLRQTFDIVTFQHSFEHMPDPQEILRSVHRVLADDGLCVIRIPVSDSYAWEHYGVDWVQLDAPRHLFIHSVDSMKALADQTGLEVVKVVWDSDEFQFWGSEQYLRDIPLRDDASYLNNPSKSIFSAHEIEGFRSKAKELNALGRGDQAAFFIAKRRNG
jgi:SAM-dependent methyltransferase